MLIDTHAHVQFDDFAEDLSSVLARAKKAGVLKLIAVGVNDVDSANAISVAANYEHMWASAGLHPHDANRGKEALEAVRRLSANQKVVAIGECGLDFYKSTTTPADQERAIRYQIELGLERKLPMIFHVREAFRDFWRILDSYRGVRGVVHSFTAGEDELNGSLDRGLYIALNGIMTFTKNPGQLMAAKRVPLNRLILETDCPFLSPTPLRGRRNEPANVAITAEFLAKLRAEALSEFSDETSRNASSLFGI